MPQHRWACGVGFRLLDQTYFAQHFACPFEAVASVHAWERVGATRTHIGAEWTQQGAWARDPAKLEQVWIYRLDPR